jgi:hypothetical protein
VQCVVDAGEIVKVKAKSARESAWLAMTALGDRARFPITVHVPATGEQLTFLLDQPAPAVSHQPKPPAPAARRKALRQERA